MRKKKYLEQYLKKLQWSMGNGQCPECFGLKPFTFERYTRRSHGHKQGCLLAKSMQAAGFKIIYRSQEHQFNKRSGFYKMFEIPLKTRNKFFKEFDKIIVKAFKGA